MGLLAKRIGLPPLLGYLMAGFAITASLPFINELMKDFGDAGSVNTHSDALSHVAHAGILLLLFTVGLKIKIKQIVQPVVVGTGLIHILFSIAFLSPVIYFIFEQDIRTSFLLGCTLSFSSTVLAASVLEVKQEIKAFHGQIAIGVLIIQDLMAMVLMSGASGTYPTPWGLLVLLVFFSKPLIYKLLDASGHSEMLMLSGLGLALIAGGAGFSAFGLSGELGALVFGALCAGHPKSSELNKALWGIKELFLIAFFLSIGLNGLPTMGDLSFALAMTILLPIQAIVFFLLLISFKLKARSAFLTSTTLTNFSEFSLIVAASVLPEWLVPLSIAVSLSFVISAPINHYAHPLFDKIEWLLSKFERKGHHPDESPITIGDADILIMGMGKIGRSAYNAASNSEYRIVGFDSDANKIKSLQDEKYNVVYADAEHGNFWKRLNTKPLKAVILAMDCGDATLIATKALRKSGFDGFIISHTEYQDFAEKLLKAGISESYVTMEEVGNGLVSHALQELNKKNIIA